ncbi:hypothetical protein ACQ4M4_16025 [Leptolyngbya sp. AN02str]|uniref:hypothetical protein n=1 Tax=Leptolyngbya sp. AN02str TaxID=3423363 RepID=UPI003D314828
MKAYARLTGMIAGVALGLSMGLAPVYAQTLILQEEGALEEGDMVLPSDNSLYDEFKIEGTAGQTVVVDMKSGDFVAYLAVLDPENPANPVLGENGNVSGTNDARLEVTLPRDGTFVVIANGLDSNSRGEYTLEITLLEE